MKSAAENKQKNSFLRNRRRKPADDTAGARRFWGLTFFAEMVDCGDLHIPCGGI